MSKSPSSRAWTALKPPLAEWILDAVTSMGFEKMTPVQASTIPLFMGNKDVVVEAVTGSGKTLTFLIPVIERLLRLEEPVRKHHVAAIIISPTRELASQIYNVLLSLLRFHGPSAALLGPEEDVEEELGSPQHPEDVSMKDADASAQPQSESTLKVVPQLLVGGATTAHQDLKYFLEHSPNLLVSTPGRLLEILRSPHVHCPQSSFEVLVMDEADRLLDLGFEEDLRKILSKLPKQRRTGLFSASVSEALDQIIRVGLRNPVKIAVKVRSTSGKEDQRTPASLQMKYMILPASHRVPAISKLLKTLNPVPGKTIIYLSTCAAVDYFQHVLPSILAPSDISLPFDIVPLHGKHPSTVRTKNFSRFTNAITPAILLTTDVAARGLDIPQVDLVLQIDPPTDPKVFLHRCGRAGRAGRKGLSIVFLTPGREEDYVHFLSVRKTPITPLAEPSITVSNEEATLAAETMRETALKDRAIHDKAQRAFVSWVQAYRKHTASSIFRVADLDWADLGKAWALLKLPRMPELKKWEGDPFLGSSMDWDGYGYKDKVREKQRREGLKQKEVEKEKGNMGAGNGDQLGQGHKDSQTGEKRAWSQKMEHKEEKARKREKRQDKREKDRWAKMGDEERTKRKDLDTLLEKVRAQYRAQEEEFEGFGD